MRALLRATAAVVVAVVTLGVYDNRASSDEGMWLFNNAPKQLLKEKYKFEITAEWLEHLQKSSVRFNSGGSGSFVSPDGLVMTNHHVGATAIQKLSTKERDLMTNGFHAKKREEELKCVDEELNVLMEITDVTDQVNVAVKPNMTAAEAQKARRAVINTIEADTKKKSGMEAQVVTLYQGGQYHLYQYKKYRDVRLVFAPEKAIAFFGGDPDNFEFPRYDLDVCFFRVYEDNKPAKVKHHLQWSEQGVKEGELTFVSGHPGKTDRMNTIEHLEFGRDLDLPFRLNLIRRREVALKSFSDRSKENARRAEDDLFSYQNSRKARLGMLAGLQDPTVMAKKQAEEKSLRDAVAKNPKLEEYATAWNEVSAALKSWREIYFDHYLFERGAAFNSDTFGLARTLVRLSEERKKPNADRLREFSEAGMDSLKEDLFSEAPIYEDLEIVKLADSLSMMMEVAGADKELVKKILDGKSPADRAADLIRNSKVRDVAVRKQLEADEGKALAGSNDPMILLAKLVDGPARAVRKTYEEKVDEPLKQAYGKLAKARFAAYGTGLYPDATFTLRLAFGEAKGFTENGVKVPWATTIGGTFKHAEEHGNVYPFQLPKRWLERKDKLNLDTPFNFVSTADIIGGNSGSPVVNKKGELVGIIFDGNIQSLVLDYIYTDEVARAVSVHSAGIIEALDKVYDAHELVGELRGKK